MGQPILDVQAVSKSYGPRRAVDRVNLQVPRGTCYGLLGPNGAGKSTLISMITGTLDADEGVAELEGILIGTTRLDAKARIGYAPQDLALYEDLSAHQNLNFFGLLYGLSGSHLKNRIDLALQVVGLADRAREPVRNFSGGMKRRLNIAVAMLHDPVLLVLDEPTVGVDPQSRNLIFEALEQLVSEGKTVLYTTHYMEEVERLCERVAILDQGQVIAEGKVSELHRLLPASRGVQIELREPFGADPNRFSDSMTFEADRKSIILEIDDLTRDLPEALIQIQRYGGIIESVRTQKPSLEQVFLKLTGRALRD